MKLSEFKAMWEEDGTKFVKQAEKVHGKGHWYLFNVHFPYGTADYGRHMAIILKVDSKTREVLKHDTKNTSSAISNKPAPWTTEIQQWFDKHVGRY